MKELVFNFENIREVEKAIGAKLYSYFEMGTPSATFKFPTQEGESEYSAKEIQLKQGESVFVDESGNVFKKMN